MLGRALNAYREDFQSLTDVLPSYEAEVVKRGSETVFSSGQNSVMLHDWEQLLNSPLF